MMYVEWLRVRNALRVCAIVVAALLVMTLGVKIWVTGLVNTHLAQIDKLQNDPSSKVTHTTLPDGTKRTVIDNAREHKHIVIDDRGYDGESITITEPNNGDSHSMNVGSVHIVTNNNAVGGQEVNIDTNGPTGFAVYTIGGFILALIIATVLGAPFAKENDGHLEIALTTPVDRSIVALRAIGIDLLGIVAALVLGTIVGVLGSAIFQRPNISFSEHDFGVITVEIVASFAWYALLTAATASLKRGYGLLLGLSWVASTVVIALSHLKDTDNTALAAVGQFFNALTYLDPLRYVAFMSPESATITNSAGNVGTGTVSAASHGTTDLLALGILFVVYISLAVLQWRRVEA